MNNAVRKMTVADIRDSLESVVPPALQEPWDNSGLIIGFESNSVKRILTCLEINEDVIKEAAEIGAEMIVSHHPLIFSAKKTLNHSVCSDRMVMELIKRGISVYSAHTSFDKVKGGNNDTAAELLGLENVRNLKGLRVAEPADMIRNNDEADIGRIGRFAEPVRLEQAAAMVSEKFDVELRSIRAVGEPESTISTAGVCTGAGAEFAEMAADSGCELLITGDVKYHQAQAALELGICLLDAGHYGTEKLFAKAMTKKLEPVLPEDVEIIESTVELEPFRVF